MKFRSFATVTAALVVASATLATPAFAGWYGGAVIVAPAPHAVYVAPPPPPRTVYVAPPLPPVYVTPHAEYVAPRPVYVAPPPHPAVWVPGHWAGSVWVPAHWA